MALKLTMVLSAAGVLFGQAPRNIVGTVSEIGASKIGLKPDNGPALTVAFTPETVFQRVAPGEKDLKNAAAIDSTQLAAGDRVLVTLRTDAAEARRVIVMPAAEIAKRNETDHEDWMRRGVSGVVTAKGGNRITLGENKAAVTVGETTTYRRYAPDSVRFADARPSSFAEIRAGDQLRARGEKSPDGLNVAAAEVVFGTFLTKAGEITAVNAASREITIKDLETGKPLVVRVTADSQLKRMPSFGGHPGAPGRGFQPPAAGGRPGGPDVAQMLDRMPAAKLEDLKPGESVVVSSTRGASKDSVTAIMLVANADLLIRMATAQTTPGLSPGGPSGIEMPAMIP